MIENHYFLFASNRDHNSTTILNRQLNDNKIACSLLDQLLQSIYIFIVIIYCKICTSSVDNIFIMILTQAAEVK